MDFETTNLDKGDPINPANKLILACWEVWRDGECTTKHLYNEEGIEYHLAELVTDIEESDFWVAHNAKFEAQWLARCGYKLGSKLAFDTQIAEYVIAGNRNWTLSLDEIAKRRLGDQKESIVSKLIKGGISSESIPKSWLVKYCLKDVELTRKLFVQVREQLKKDGLLACFYSRSLATQVLADIETKGLQLDCDRVNKLHHKYTKMRTVALAQLYSNFGEINFNSDKQVRKLLFEDLKFPPPLDTRGKPMVTPKGGELAVSAPALARLKAKNKKQQLFLELFQQYTEADGMLSKYLDKMKTCCDEDEGILYGQFNQTVTDTHRLSSTGKKYKIQLQNIARHLKPVFKTRNAGWMLGEADESQLEYRAAVDMARDKAGLADILNKVDVHYLTRDVLFPHWKEEPEDVQKELRTAAKASTFKPLYGGSSGTELEKKYYSAFKQKHVEISAWQQQNVDGVLRTGKLRIPSGLIFYWPDTRVTPTGFITNSQSICNYPVQNFATAELVILALVLLWYYMKAEDMQSYICNTVHDSIISEICPGEEELYEKLAVKALTTDVVELMRKLFDYDFVTPLDAELVVRSHWSDTEKWKEKYLI